MDEWIARQFRIITFAAHRRAQESTSPEKKQICADRRAELIELGKGKDRWKSRMEYRSGRVLRRLLREFTLESKALSVARSVTEGAKVDTHSIMAIFTVIMTMMVVVVMVIQLLLLL